MALLTTWSSLLAELVVAGLDEELEPPLEALPSPPPQATDTARIENPTTARDRTFQGLRNICFTPTYRVSLSGALCSPLGSGRRPGVLQRPGSMSPARLPS